MTPGVMNSRYEPAPELNPGMQTTDPEQLPESAAAR